MNKDYYELVNFMKYIRSYFIKNYESVYSVGKLNHSSKDYTYFSLTPDKFKKEKLKFVIILDHLQHCFTICLSGQNKDVRKQYWNIFKGSDWDKYHLAESIDNSLMIIDHTLVENPNFSNGEDLKTKIKKEASIFIQEMRNVLELN